MNRPIPLLQLPDPPLGTDPAIREWKMKVVQEVEGWTQEVQSLLNSGSIQGVGATINLNSASDPLVKEISGTDVTISPTHCIHHVTGTNALKNIMVPFFRGVETYGSSTLKEFPLHTGPLYLIRDAAWSVVATGNITTAPTLTTNNVLCLVYDGANWHPTAAS